MTRSMTDVLSTRTILAADGAVCLAMGAGLVAFRAALADPTGLEPGFLAVAGGLLLPVGVFILAVATGWIPARFGLAVIVAGNLAWAAASVVLPLSGLIAPTAFGWGLVLAQATIVAVVSALEARGLRREASMA